MLSAQADTEPAPDPQAAPNRAPAEAKSHKHRLHLTDGSILTGTLEQGAVVIDTAYGKLTVPPDDIERIVPGLDRRTQLRDKVTRLVKQLGADDFPQREKAEQALLAIGPRVLSMLKQQSADDDLERAKRLRTVIDQREQMQMEAEDEFMEDEPADALIPQDQVFTRQFKIVGRVEAEQLVIATDYGQLTVDLGKIERVEVARPAAAIKQATVQVDGSHKAMISHLKTGIRVNRGDKVTIRATGKITLTPWGAQAFSIPDGMVNYGWYLPNQVPMGALVGRIGADGQVFMLGAKKQFVAEKSGMLELAFAIQHGYANNQFPGEYKVRIRVEPR